VALIAWVVIRPLRGLLAKGHKGLLQPVQIYAASFNAIIRFNYPGKA
jgi:hypothetical protein